MHKLKIFTGFVLWLLLQTTVYATSNEKVDQLISTFMKENNVGGMSVAVVNKDKIKIYNYGYANELTKTPTSNNTIYTIASFTKTVTATLAAVAAVENKLDLNAPFNQYIPELRNAKNLNKITTKELLAHVSSLPFDFAPRPKTYQAAMQDLLHFKSPYAPGTQYSYSNAGIGTVGYVLQNVYGKSYQDILNTQLLSPLKMMSTYLIVPEEKEKFIALGHDGNGKEEPYDKNITVWFAAASLKSTISDMAKFLSAHINHVTLNNKKLSAAMDLVHQNAYCLADKLECEQLAWQAHAISELTKSAGDTGFIRFNSEGTAVFGKKAIIENKDFAGNRIFIDKTGSGYGMSSYMVYIPDEKVGVVLLINKNIGDERIQLAREILISIK